MERPFVDYERHGHDYALRRRAEPRIAERIHAALGDARTVINVGAGTGSYEPDDRWVLAVEPSATMRAQRPPHLAPALNGTAESLPFDDDTFDAAMAAMTIHHWRPPDAGLKELRRVAHGPVVVFTFELEAIPEWLRHYMGPVLAIEEPRFPPVEEIAAALGGKTRIEAIPTPGDCHDGFVEAFWNRPEALLDPNIRASQSMWELVDDEIEEGLIADLAADLASGEWDRRWGELRHQEQIDGSIRLVISE